MLKRIPKPEFKITLSGVLTVIFFTFVTVGLFLAWKHDTNKTEYDAWLIEKLGVQTNPAIFRGEERQWKVETPRGSFITVRSVTEPFYHEYWNGSQVLFYTPARIYDAALTAYDVLEWCDPRLIMAIAHSESPRYTNHDKENPATAMGVLQFIRTTWNGVWTFIFKNMPEKWQGKVTPPRTNIPASFFAACIYTRNNGMIEASLDSEEAFVHEFAVDPPVWNQHEPQARYVWRAYQAQLQQGDISVPDETFYTDNGLGIFVTKDGIPFYQNAAIEILIYFGLTPPTVFAHDDSPGEPGDDDDDWELPPGTTCVPLLNKYQLGPRGYHTGCEGTKWSCGNIIGWDYIAPDGTPYRAPFPGRITGTHYDRLGNSVATYRFDNGMVLGILHLHFPKNLRIGSKFDVGDKIGSVGNIGNSSTAHGHIWWQKSGVNRRNHDPLFCREP